MLFNKSTVIFSALALCNVVVAAQPPACLLSVVGYVISDYMTTIPGMFETKQ